MLKIQKNDRPIFYALVFVGFGAFAIATSQWLEPPPTDWDIIFTAIVTLFTVVLAISTILLWRETAHVAKHTVVSERAYVKLSHSPPGLDIDPNGLCLVRVIATNSGRTPARVTDLRLKLESLPNNVRLPAIPNYQRQDQGLTAKGFLVANDEFSHGEMFRKNPINVASVKAGTERVWLYGYVDYIDVFGQRHRGGYMRVYASGRDDRAKYLSGRHYMTRNNLVFEAQEGYNYDRLRQPGEGIDWDEVES